MLPRICSGSIINGKMVDCCKMHKKPVKMVTIMWARVNLDSSFSILDILIPKLYNFLYYITFC